MTRAKIIDIIKSSLGGKVRLDSIFKYKELLYAEDFEDDDLPNLRAVKELVGGFIAQPFIYNLPVGSETPVIIDFVANTITIGTEDPVDLGVDMVNYQLNPDIKFQQVIDANNSKPIGNEGWITNQEWSDDEYSGLFKATIQPDIDFDTGLTIDNINIIIKP